MSNEIAFVVGASGYTGQALVRELRTRGIECVAHLRRGSPKNDALAKTFEALGARVDTSDWEPSAIAQAIERTTPTCVFALLGTTKKRQKLGVRNGETEDANSYERVDYGLTKMLLDATVAKAPSARFVYLSSLGVTDTTTNAYLAARAKAERALRESALAWTVARPSFITGADREESRPAERVSSIVIDGALGALALFGATGPRDAYGSMNAETLAIGLVEAALDPACRGAVLDAAALRLKARKAL
jgi:uncharacterized protein YbjT (DUF2867 family)